MEIKIESPTRIDLGGGTLDCWPLYSIIGDCYTINLSIDIYTGVSLEPRNDSKIIIEVADFNYKKEFVKLKELFDSTDAELELLKSHLDFWRPKNGFNLKTYSQSPVGGGLGGSSSLSISLLKAFSEWSGRDLSLAEIVTVASNIEAKALNTPTGTQDYIPAASPGLNIIKYDQFGFKTSSVDFDSDVFNSHMLLVNTGVAHHSGINNWQVIKNVIEKDVQTMTALREIAEISKELKEICEKQDWESLPQIFRREYKSRVKLSPGFTCPEIKKVEEVALNAGAESVKILGAGGGGCVLVWCPPKVKESVAKACQNANLQVLKAKAVKA